MVDLNSTPNSRKGGREVDRGGKVVHRDAYSPSSQPDNKKSDSVQSAWDVKALGDSGGFEFVNRVLHCVGCNSKFDFTPGEQRFFQSRGLMNQPKRCKSCRVSRRERSNNRSPALTASGSQGTGTRPSFRSGWAQPPPRPPRSLRPITTTLGVVVYVGSGACLVSYGEGSTVKLQPSRVLGVGTYVTLTRSTKGKRLRFHGVVGDSPPDGGEDAPIPLRGTILGVTDDEVSVLFQPGFGASPSTLVCPAEEAPFQVSKGSVVLFSPCFRDGVLSIAGIVGLASPVSIWSNRAPPQSSSRWAVAPTRLIEVLHPKSAALLSTEMGIDADFRSPPGYRSSLVAHSFYDVHQSGPVPRVNLLAMEEHMLLQSHSPSSVEGKSVPISDSLLECLRSGVKGVLVATKSTGHLLASYLHDSLEEVNALGLSRTVKVLYPVDAGVTPANIRGTVSSKLFSPRLLPIARVQVLSRPLALAQVAQATGKPTGVVRLQHFALITMVVSDDVLPELPPVSSLAVSQTDLGLGSGSVGFKSAGCGVKLLVPITEPRNTFSREAIQKALPSGTILHSTSHSMKHSYTSYVATFPTAGMAGEFVRVVASTNQSMLPSSQQWLVAPSPGFWEGNGVYTIFTTAKYDKNQFYGQFSAEWAYAVNHTQIRFKTSLSLKEICKAADAVNHSSRGGLLLARLLVDGFHDIILRKKARSRPVLRPLTPSPAPVRVRVTPLWGSPLLGSRTWLRLRTFPYQLPSRTSRAWSRPWPGTGVWFLSVYYRIPWLSSFAPPTLLFGSRSFRAGIHLRLLASRLSTYPCLPRWENFPLLWSAGRALVLLAFLAC